MDILDTAPIADEVIWAQHVTGFVGSFIQKSHRDRWLHLLLKRPKQVYSNSHKLHNQLDESRYSPLIDEANLSLNQTGVYYDFMDEPVMLTLADALLVGRGRNGIFSIEPGKLAIYFFHEDENILCKLSE